MVKTKIRGRKTDFTDLKKVLRKSKMEEEKSDRKKVSKRKVVFKRKKIFSTPKNVISTSSAQPESRATGNILTGTILKKRRR